MAKHNLTVPKTKLSAIVCLLFSFALLVLAIPPGWGEDDSAEKRPWSNHPYEHLVPFGEVIPLSDTGRAAIGLQVERVTRSLLPVEIALPGVIEAIPTQQFAQHAPLSGRISKVCVKLGDTVRNGQVLAVVDSPEMNELAAQLLQGRLELESQYAQQRATLDEQVRQASERFELAKTVYARTDKLVNEKIAAHKDLVEAHVELEIAETHYNTSVQSRDLVLKALKSKIALMEQPLRQRLQMLGVDEAHIRDMLKEQSTIKSVPIICARDGIITTIDTSVGTSINPTNLLFTVSDLRKIWATASVYENEMSRMHLGQKVLIKVHGASEQFEGTITFIGSQLDNDTRTLPVKAELANPNLILKPDMYAELYVQVTANQPVITLPQDAVVHRGEHEIAFVSVNGGFQPTFVESGRHYQNRVEIKRGLQVGQMVVVRGAFQLAAEMVKRQGGEEQFSQPTEDHSVGSDDESRSIIARSIMTPQVIGFAIFAAFLFGFAVSTVFIRRTSATKGGTASSPPAASSAISTQPSGSFPVEQLESNPGYADETDTSSFQPEASRARNKAAAPTPGKPHGEP